ncbi:MAG: hypothetical protein ACYCST_21585 [Acidimicrobiales bacterium]
MGQFMQLITPWSETQPELYTDYDGNRMTLVPSRKVAALKGHRCPHFDDIHALGDAPWHCVAESESRRGSRTKGSDEANTTRDALGQGRRW